MSGIAVNNYYSSCVSQTDSSGIWLWATLPLFLAFFILTRSEFPQRHVSPHSQMPLTEGDFHLLWDYSQDMKTGQRRQGCQSRTPITSLFATPDIPYSVCPMSHSVWVLIQSCLSDTRLSFSLLEYHRHTAIQILTQLALCFSVSGWSQWMHFKWMSLDLVFWVVLLPVGL